MNERPEGDRATRVLDWIGPWAPVAMVVLSLTVLYTDISRFSGPIGDQYLPSIMQPGGADFIFPYDGARALVMGVNPYHNNVPELGDPYGRFQGQPFQQLYPPTHLVMLLPLARLVKGNRLLASRIWFHCNLAFLILLAFVSWRLIRRLLPSATDWQWLLLPFFLFVYALGPGMLLLLERGQSDLLTSLLCWSAALLSLRRRWFLAMFLATWGTMIKGYPLIFLPGLAVLGLTRRHWMGTIAGAAAAVLIFLAPAWRYIPDAMAALASRSGMFWAVWYNHSFRNLAYALSPAWALSGHKLLTGFGVVAAVSCWTGMWRAHDDRDRVVWLTLFTTCSLGTMLGYSSLSCTYNIIIVLPGAVLLALSQRPILALAGATRRYETALGLAITVAGFLLFIAKLGSGTFPVGAVGLVGVLAISCTLAVTRLVLALRQGRSPAPIPSSSAST